MQALRLSRLINPHTALKFNSAFSAHNNNISRNNDFSDPDVLVNTFNSTCSSILDSIAPLTQRKHKIKASPWLNETTRAQRHEWRQAERKWRKDGLKQRAYHKLVKAERAKYFSNLISNNSHPRALFKTINFVIQNPLLLLSRIHHQQSVRSFCLFKRC